MPEVRFRVRWPDGRVETCYSPSTIIKDHLRSGASYTVSDFLARCRDGLHAASDRVRAIYGSGCSRAMAQLAAIEASAARQEQAALVTIEGFDGRAG